MKSWYQNPVPTLLTLLLHAGILYLVIVGWQLAEPEKQIKVKPSYVKAKLVTMAEVKPKAAPVPKSKPTPQVKPKPEPKPEPKPVPKPPPPKKQPEPKPVPKPKPPPPKPQVDQKALDAERTKKLAEQRAREAAQEQRQAETDEEIAASYIGIIQQTLILSWSRPPGSRNGMEVVLAIRLIPTGEVVDVKVVTSSGNVSFDQAAVNAVQRAERFPELANMPGRMFEQHFRQLKLVFRPEDMKL